MRLGTATAAIALLLAGTAFAGDVLTAQQQAEARQHYRKGEALMFEESFERAAAEFTMATRLDPEFAMAFYSLGQANMALKRYEEAATAYEGCRDILQDRSVLDVKRRGEQRQAREDEMREIEAALWRWGGPEAAPNDVTMRLQQRLRLLDQQQERDSVNRVEVPPELSIALGSAYFRLGRLEDAEREYQAAIDNGDDTGAAHNNVAVIYMMTDRLEEARAALRYAEEFGFRVNPRFKEDLKQRVASAE